jgi:hypothetical protein
MALSKIDVANMVTGAVPVANGGTALTSGFVNGFTGMMNQWRITSDFSDDGNPISSNWELADTDGYGSLGSNMTQSSGVFTFPATGIYYIHFIVSNTADSIDGQMQIQVETTTDGTNFGGASEQMVGVSRASDSNTYSTSFVFDVTNVSTHKCRFVVASANSDTTTHGHSSQNETHVTFIKMGDT